MAMATETSLFSGSAGTFSLITSCAVAAGVNPVRAWCGCRCGRGRGTRYAWGRQENRLHRYPWLCSGGTERQAIADQCNSGRNRPWGAMLPVVRAHSQSGSG